MRSASRFARSSIHHEQSCALRRPRTMRLRTVGHLVAHTGRQLESAAVFQFGLELAIEAKEDVTLLAPMVRDIARRILDHPHADAAEFTRAPRRDAGVAGMLG